MIRNIIVIGCGGIGSRLAEFIYDAKQKGQLGIFTKFVFIDDDAVESKNLKYQNFIVENVGMNKARVMGERFGFEYLTTRIHNKTQLEDTDLIIGCVDNNKTRKVLYEYAKEKGIKYVDLRSKGKIVAVYTDEYEDYIKELGNIENEESSSCQNEFELSNNLIQYGNLIVAAVGLQYIVNIVRGESNLKKWIKSF